MFDLSNESIIVGMEIDAKPKLRRNPIAPPWVMTAACSVRNGTIDQDLDRFNNRFNIPEALMDEAEKPEVQPELPLDELQDSPKPKRVSKGRLKPGQAEAAVKWAIKWLVDGGECLFSDIRRKTICDTINWARESKLAPPCIQALSRDISGSSVSDTSAYQALVKMQRISSELAAK